MTTPVSLVLPPQAGALAATLRAKPQPRSCDTFVAFPPATVDGSVIFGKNSDRTEEVRVVSGCSPA